MQHPLPEELRLSADKRTLRVVYHGEAHALSAEYLRVYSPSAEVRGHAPGQEVLQTGKRNVAITGIEPAGNYAVKIVFSDGHSSGLYDWDYLYELAACKDEWWARYEEQLRAAGASRDE